MLFVTGLGEPDRVCCRGKKSTSWFLLCIFFSWETCILWICLYKYTFISFRRDVYLKAEVYYQQSEELHSYWLYCLSSFATWWAGIKNAWISVCEQRPSIIIEEDISKFVTDHKWHVKSGLTLTWTILISPCYVCPKKHQKLVPPADTVFFLL